MKKLRHLKFEESWIIFKSGIWKTWTPEQLIYFQLCQYHLCVPIKEFQEQLSVLAKVHNYDFKKARESKEYTDKVLKRFLVRTKYKEQSFEEFVPGSLRSILKNKDGGFLAQDFSDKLKQRLYEKNNKKDDKKSRRHTVRRRTS